MNQLLSEAKATATRCVQLIFEKRLLSEATATPNLGAGDRRFGEAGALALGQALEFLHDVQKLLASGGVSGQRRDPSPSSLGVI